MFEINLQSREPIYEQLCKNVIKLVSLGLLKPDEKLPPVRTLATEQGINPNTVSKAYQLLEKEGVIYSVVGKGSFVSSDISVVDKRKELVIEELTKILKKAEELGLTLNEINRVIDENFTQGGWTYDRNKKRE